MHLAFVQFAQNATKLKMFKKKRGCKKYVI